MGRHAMTAGWMRAAAFADEIGVKVTTVQRWCGTGKVRSRKIGGLWFVHRSELDEAYDDQRERAQRGEPLPGHDQEAERDDVHGLAGGGDDAGRHAAVTVRPVQDRRRPTSARPVETAGRLGHGGSSQVARWSLPADVAD